MSWFNLWDGLKTKTCRYLLQRYLGQFFENNLNLEQLKVDLYNGKAVVEDISLKVNVSCDIRMLIIKLIEQSSKLDRKVMVFQNSKRLNTSVAVSIYIVQRKIHTYEYSYIDIHTHAYIEMNVYVYI